MCPSVGAGTLGGARDGKEGRLPLRGHSRPGREDLKLQGEVARRDARRLESIELFESAKNSNCSKSAIYTFWKIAIANYILLSGR